MKTLLIKLTIVAFLFFFISSCKKDDEMGSTEVTAVKKLYEPSDNASVELESSASASLYFEWEHAKAADGGMVLYEVAFDVAGGDFSSPFYKVTSDNNGGYNHATISHEQLNKIAKMGGIASAEAGTVIWTVFSSKGINDTKAEESRSLEITRLPGFADVPTDVYVTGMGSEGGSDLSSAGIMKAVEPGRFEIYTQLTAGEAYYFTDANSGTPRQFYTENGVVKEGTTMSTVGKTAVYRIELNFNIGSAEYTEITDIELYFCPDNAFLFSHDYTGGGVWKASNQPITFKQESWGRDERYKFRMTTIDSEGATVYEWWGTPNTDHRPTVDSPPSYYYLYPVDDSQWDGKFKFADEIDNSYADISVIFSVEGDYTHEVVKVGDQ